MNEIATDAELRFPYMRWAKRESFLSPFSLSQSGMPPPDPSLFEGLTWDSAYAGVEALPRLEKRLATLFGVDPARVIVTPGASAAMHLLAQRWFRPGTRVVAEIPSYEPLRALPPHLGAHLALVPRRPEAGWAIDLEHAERALAGGQPAHLFLTNPHNPTGVCMDAERMRALAELAEKGGGVLVSCEVYGEFLPREERVHAFALAPNAVSIGSLTKAYGLGALRIGWILLGEGLAAERERLLDLANLTWVDVPTMSARAALWALERLEVLLLPLRAVEARSRPPWAHWLATSSEVECVVPERGIMAFPYVVGARESRELARRLQREHQVDVVPGEFFGAPGFVRVCCGVPAETLVEGIGRLERGLAALRAEGAIG